ncbi:MAG TPA: hypothetical protein VMG41_07400 [Gemmatimonadales bacterium]|nr:hypothetical protein [Gemmatimonadales bacterium]
MRKAMLALVAALGLVASSAGAALAETPGIPTVDSGYATVATAWLLGMAMFVTILMGVSSRLKDSEPAVHGSREEPLRRAA